MVPESCKRSCAAAFALAFAVAACSSSGRDPTADATDAPASDAIVDTGAVAVDAADDPRRDPGSEDADRDPTPNDAASDPATGDASAVDVPVGSDADAGADAEPSDVDPETWTPPFADADFCGEVDGFGPVFPDVVAEWTRQGAPEDVGLLIVGSSSVRRWEDFARLYSGYAPLQRGFGGAQLGEVAYYADPLVVAPGPDAVIVFAGTNDVAAGVAPEVVVERFRCLRQRIGRGLGWGVPVLFIGITPTPARWARWDDADAVNEAVRALEAIDPALHYVDVPAAFLATGSPPAADLFVWDRLHLSESGYALWNGVLEPVVDEVLGPVAAPSVVSPLGSGERVLVDLGPNNEGDGEDTPAPDYLGQTWNNWHDVDGGDRAVPGQWLGGLVTSDGGSTGLGFVVTGGFGVNGWANGGYRWPDHEQLGDVAVGSATGDYFWSDDDDRSGGFALTGLSPDATYTLRLFASRDDDERRVTEYVVHGAEARTATLQTSGPGAGTDDRELNDDDVAELTGLRPDPWGHLFVDVRVAEGSYAYLSLIELVGE